MMVVRQRQGLEGQSGRLQHVEEALRRGDAGHGEQLAPAQGVRDARIGRVAAAPGLERQYSTTVLSGTVAGRGWRNGPAGRHRPLPAPRSSNTSTCA